MTQHGTSVVIKQTNDGLGSAELRLLEMLQVVTRDKKKETRERNRKIVHLSLKRLYSSGFGGLESIPACIGLPLYTETHMHTAGNFTVSST